MRVNPVMALLTNTLAALALISATLTFIVGCGTEAGLTDQVPTQVQADPSKGEVSVKGERGEKGETGPAGPQGTAGKDGKDGASGAEGKMGSTGVKGDSGAAGAQGTPGQDQIQGLWKDSVTGKSWVYIQGKFKFNEVATLCTPWRLPTNLELQGAVRHGLARILTIPSPAATEWAWTSELQTGSINRYGVTLLNADELQVGSIGILTQSDYWRVYCVKPD